MVDSSSMYRQSQLFVENRELISTKKEDHWFDRKSFKIKPEALANALIGFANSDGGTMLIGVNDSGEIEGVDGDSDHLNALRQAAIDFTVPPVPHSADLIDCSSSNGIPNHLLAIEIPPSNSVHKNHKGEAFRRVGDENRKLDFEATLELTYDKGVSFFDGSVVLGSTYNDLDRDSIEAFVEKVRITTEPRIALKARGLLAEHADGLLPTVAAVLLFSNNPERFMPGAVVRVLRYDGTEAQYGKKSNVTFDQRISGSLDTQITGAGDLLSDLVPSTIRLNEQTGRFESASSIPQSVWLEAIVNAVTHRSYSQQGDHIRVVLFDDRLEVTSPGRLPGPVRLDNIRYTRFSRNPRIARILSDLQIVRELNEGVNRMFADMASAGLPDPELRQSDAGFKVTLFTRSRTSDAAPESEWDNPAIRFIMRSLSETGRASVARTVAETGMSAPTVRRHFQRLSDAGIIQRVARSSTDPRAYWTLQKPLEEE